MGKTESREWVVVENNGQQIFGILHRPILIKNPPLVVLMHGFASSKHGSNRSLVSLAEELTKVGIAAFRFDFRGSGDSEGSLSEMTFEDLISDAVSILNDTHHFKGINSDRLGVFGSSLGGSIAIFAAERTTKVKSLVLWAPVASGELWYRDFVTHHSDYSKNDLDKILSTYRGIKLHPLFREQFAIMCAYKSLKQLHPIPILHMHGEKDEIVSIAHQEAFRYACPSANSSVHFIKYPNGQHALGFLPNFSEALGECVDWFKRNLV